MGGGGVVKGVSFGVGLQCKCNGFESNTCYCNRLKFIEIILGLELASRRWRRLLCKLTFPMVSVLRLVPFFRSPNPPTSLFRVFSSQSHPHHRFGRTDGRAAATRATRGRGIPVESSSPHTQQLNQQQPTTSIKKTRTYHRPPFVMCFSCCSTRCTQTKNTHTHTLTNTTRGLGTRFCNRFIHAHTPHALIIIIAPVAPITTTRQHANTETETDTD